MNLSHAAANVCLGGSKSGPMNNGASSAIPLSKFQPSMLPPGGTRGEY